jgi:hypothetical protein
MPCPLSWTLKLKKMMTSLMMLSSFKRCIQGWTLKPKKGGKDDGRLTRPQNKSIQTQDLDVPNDA